MQVLMIASQSGTLPSNLLPWSRKFTSYGYSWFGTKHIMAGEVLKTQASQREDNFLPEYFYEKNQHMPSWLKECMHMYYYFTFFLTFSHVFNITRIISLFLNCVDPLW